MTKNTKDHYKLNKDLKFNLFSKSEREVWRNFDINIDSYCDNWFAYNEQLRDEIYKFSQTQIKEICKLYKLKAPGIDESYCDVFLGNIHSSIDFFCIIKFVSKNPLAYSRIFNVPKYRGKTNKKAVCIQALITSRKTDLQNAYIQLFIQKSGKAKYIYEISASTQLRNLQEAQKLLYSLTRYLKKIENKKFHIRYIDKIDSGYHFLLLKETGDKLYPAIPQNLRVVIGSYLLISIDYHLNKLSVYTKIFKEASRIRFYLAKRTKSQIRYVREYSPYKPDTFFDYILNSDPAASLHLITAEFRRHNLGDSTFHLIDRNKKNDIIKTIKEFKDKKILELADFSEFKTFTFRHMNLNFKVNVLEDRWRQLKLEIQDKGIPPNALVNFKNVFEVVFKIPFNKHLQNEDSNLDKAAIIRSVLDKPTLEMPLPDHVEDILLDLINDGVLQKPIDTIKRKCINCYHVYWQKGECPKCGNDAHLEGEYLDIQIDISATNNLLLHYLKKLQGLKTKKISKQIDKAKFTFIDIINTEGISCSIYVALNNVPEQVAKQFQETGNSLIVILLKHNAGILPDIQAKGFAALDFASLYYQLDSPIFDQKIREAIQFQKESWKAKLIKKGGESYARYNNRSTEIYKDQQFEIDIYNMLHHIFLVGDRLGGKFAGVKAPDGIVSIQNYSSPMARFCLAWDCKYSVASTGYKLNDSPAKHRHYINALKKNEKVIFYGELKTYVIISQNMNLDYYQRFCDKLLLRFRWTGQVLFMQANIVTSLYKLYLDNEALISIYPTPFYSKIYKMLKVTDKKDSLPFKQLSKRKFIEVSGLIKSDYKALKKSFVFERREFA